jgi:hypothetical protein
MGIYSNIKEEFVETNDATRGGKWETVSARVTPEEKEDIYRHCKGVIKLPYSVITRLIWRRILNDYRTMPGVRHDEMKEVETAVEQVMVYVPVIRKQREMQPKFF